MTHSDAAADQSPVERDRQAADARYNDALTALDRAIAAAAGVPSVDRDLLAHVHTALVVFLQQITPFVETKERALAGQTAARTAELRRAIEPISELRTQMAVVQRAIQALTRTGAPGTAAPSTAAPSTTAPSTRHPQDHQYVAFEDQFRGTPAAVAQRLRAYVPIFAGAGGPVLDLGCGRGELLSAFAAAGITARGVDVNGDMVEAARRQNLDVTRMDALGALDACTDDSLGGIVATQVVEHLEPAYLMQLIATASHKLKAGAPIVLETINPACWLAFFSSYIRDLTHVKPIHPETLQYVLRANGFSSVEIRYSAPVPDDVRMKTFDIPIELRGSTDPVISTLAGVAHAVNANAMILNSLMFTHMDYAAIGYRS